MESFHYRHGNEIREITSRELADELRREGVLTVGLLVERDDDSRCLWELLWNIRLRDRWEQRRYFTDESLTRLRSYGLTITANDAFVGTPEERCAHFVGILEEL